ncbi:MAG: helix-turn-helix transcriptional regulator [Clostridia bacterium]|nr:helix-turn-helix transcriptional regulator [Clostridia bacterium]
MGILRHYDRDGFYMHYSFDRVPDVNDFWTHFHDRYEVLYVKQGRGRFICEGRIYQLTDGLVFLVKRGEVHRIEIDDTYPYERMAFNFDKTAFLSVDRTGMLFEPFGKETIVYTEDGVRQALDKIADIPACLDHEAFRVRALSLLIRALSEIRFCCDREEEEDHGKITHTSVRMAVKYIHDNLFSEITLDAVAKAAFMSKSHISRLFRETTGRTVCEYVTVKRLIAARRMIERGEHPTEVAAVCGFRHYSTFWRSYRKVFGVSPTEECAFASAGEPIAF